MISCEGCGGVGVVRGVWLDSSEPGDHFDIHIDGVDITNVELSCLVAWVLLGRVMISFLVF